MVWAAAGVIPAALVRLTVATPPLTATLNTIALTPLVVPLVPLVRLNVVPSTVRRSAAPSARLEIDKSSRVTFCPASMVEIVVDPNSAAPTAFSAKVGFVAVATSVGSSLIAVMLIVRVTVPVCTPLPAPLPLASVTENETVRLAEIEVGTSLVDLKVTLCRAV